MIFYRDGAVLLLPSSQVQPGDLLLLEQDTRCSVRRVVLPRRAQVRIEGTKPGGSERRPLRVVKTLAAGELIPVVRPFNTVDDEARW